MAALATSTTLDGIATEFAALSGEFNKFEEVHKTYLQQLSAWTASQGKCLKELHHQKYRLEQLSEALAGAGKNATSQNESEKVAELKKEISERKSQLADITQTLPRKNNIYLRVILGDVNLSLLSKEEKFRYKDQYEHFKLVVTVISVVLSFCNLFLFKYRFLDAAFHFLLVWYYCTLTIREGILRVNGSNIQTWWVAHHYITTFCTGILVTWPDTPIYQQFRNQFYYFCLYIGLVQILQYRYQHGQLYKLKALGERGSMDVTIEGFQTWMWRGLGFLLPFLFGGYLFQLYNAYTLWNLSNDPRCTEWQVSACAIIFFGLFLGNSITALTVVKNKLQRTDPSNERARLQKKYK